MKTRALPFTSFVEKVMGLRLTVGQRVLCKVAFDGLEPGDLVGRERELARFFFGDVDTIPPEARTVILLELGRDSGKTLLAALWLLFAIVTTDISSRGPGDVPVGVVGGPRQRTGRHTIRVARELLRRIPGLEAEVRSDTADGFLLRRHDKRMVSVECFPMSEGGAAVRGRSVVTAVLDEAQFIRSSEEYAATDRDFYQAVSPRLMGPIVFISTRWPAPTLMRELVDKNLGAPTFALAARGDTLTMRDGSAEVARTIAREMAIDEGNARREFFCDDSGTTGDTFFDHRSIAAAVNRDRELAIPPPPQARVALGGDLALIRDSSALVAAARVGDRYLVLEVLELRPSKGEPLKLSNVVAHFAEVARRLGLKSFMADGHVRGPAREFAEAEKIMITSAPGGQQGNEATHVFTRKLLSEGRVELPNHPRLLEQLRSVVARPTEGGGLKFIKPRRAGTAHGDLVSALLLALHQLEGPVMRVFLPRNLNASGYRFAGQGRGF